MDLLDSVSFDGGVSSSDALRVLTVAGGLGAAVLAGVFYAFSVLVMPALARAPAADSVEVMQRINELAPTPAFLSTFLGTGAVSAALIVWALTAPAGSAGLLVAGGALYLVGVVGVTGAYHVTRNNALDRIDARGPGASAAWAGYWPGWTRLNHVRAMASAAASVSYLIALTH